MVETNHGSIYGPEIIRKYRYRKIEQKTISKKNSEGQVDNDFLNYYQLFRERRMNCENLNCNDPATDELEISVGIYGKHIFFFCRNCVEKFKRMIQENEY